MVDAVVLRGLSKRFGTLQANDGIQVTVRAGSIHAIIGENGAGKSTAMKMLYGIYRPDSGEILIRGEPKRWTSPRDAIAAGIGMVHQHFMLAGPYSALENVVLGTEGRVTAANFLPTFLRPLLYRKALARLQELSKHYGLEVNWEARVEELPVGVQQRIEILKLLYQEASILILDEPTAVLTPQETNDLFANLKKLAAEGKTILIITHKLKEVMNLADRVTVFRAGKVVGEREIRETNPDELASLMVGRKVSLTAEAPPKPVIDSSKPAALLMEGVSLAGGALREVSLHVAGGEVVGIAGVEGNGQSELLEVLIGPREAARSGKLSGRIAYFGGDATALTTDRIKEMGVGIVPEDRHRDGLLLERPASENFLLGLHRREPFNRGGFLDSGALEAAVSVAMEEYDVRPRDPEIFAGRMSGGNQQKLIIAREFHRPPRFLIAAQPTRGVDVGAIEFIHGRILQARASGAGVLLVSSELDEILALSDRILVMYSGRIVAQFARGEASETQLGLCMGGANA